MKRIISFILVLATLLGCLAVLPLGAWAAELASGDTLTTLRPTKPAGLVNPYLTQAYPDAQAKLDGDPNMLLLASAYNKELYANVYTGEVYVKNVTTGEILHSNPFDLTGSSSTTGPEYMSQIILKYEDVETGQEAQPLNSFKDSALHGQITIDSIVNGLRVNYALGETTKRYNIPYGIMAKDLIETLFAPMQQKIVEDVKQVVTEAGMSQKFIDRYFDFEAFCASADGQTYSTLYLLGVDYVYGNVEAFGVWFENAMNRYDVFYNYEDYEVVMDREDPEISRDSEWKKNHLDKVKMEKLAADYMTLEAYYTFQSPYLTTEGNDPSDRDKWQLSSSALQRPILNEIGKHPILGVDYYCNAIFVLDQGQPSNRMRNVESLFNEYVDGYTLAKATAAEDATGIYPLNNDKPVFYLSIEYKLTEDGFTAEVPATSIMYDEGKYKVMQIDILPYMGTADVEQDGYIFFPDGSGTIIDFEEFRYDLSPVQIAGKVYGEDYAKYIIEGMYQKNVSMPVYGTVRDQSSYTIETPYGTFPCSYAQYKNKNFEITFEYDGLAEVFYAKLPFGVKVPTSKVYILNETTGYYEEKNPSTDSKNDFYYGTVKTILREKDYKIASSTDTGYVAIIEEGAALSTIFTSFNSYTEANKNSRRMSRLGIRFVPRVEDMYSLESDKGGELEFTVQAKNKYKGSYTVRYIMLTDAKIAAEAGLAEYYEPTYVGMAKAYQNFLIDNNLLPESADIGDQLPLIIESFGVMQTQEKFLSIPFTVDVALTSFKDVETMYSELEARGIKNVKFRLTGFANGGMNAKYPVKIKWEKEAGGKSGFKDLLEYANDPARQENGLEIYPNFNFMYIWRTGNGISLKKIGARCADNRYATRVAYSSLYQMYTVDSAGGLLVTSSALGEIFEKFDKKYSKYDHNAISMTSMASDLSGDFNEDNGLTREESMNYITDMLNAVTASYSSVMTEGGNLYALKYMSQLIKAPLDSSHLKCTSRTVPFWSMVVHGHIQYAGEAFNEQANSDEALLRAIESGANLYFILSYNHTQLMKDDLMLNQYYSVDYQISRDTVDEYYKKLNAAIGDLQTYHIVDHRRIYAERNILALDYAAQLAELEGEFMTHLEQLVAGEQEAIREMILAMRALGINVGDQLSKYDTDGNGILTDTEAETAWSSYGLRPRQTVKDAVRAHYTNPIIAEIIGGMDLDIDDAQAREAADNTAGKLVFTAIINGRLKLDFGQTVGVAFDADEVIASAYRMLDVEVLREEFLAELRAFMVENETPVNGVDLVAKVGAVTYTPASSYFTTSECQDENYKSTEATVSNGTVVMVTYSNGTDTVRIILNYNVFGVNVRVDGVGDVHLSKYGYMRLD